MWLFKKNLAEPNLENENHRRLINSFFSNEEQRCKKLLIDIIPAILF